MPTDNPFRGLAPHEARDLFLENAKLDTPAGKTEAVKLFRQAREVFGLAFDDLVERKAGPKLAMLVDTLRQRDVRRMSIQEGLRELGARERLKNPVAAPRGYAFFGNQGGGPPVSSGWGDFVLDDATGAERVRKDPGRKPTPRGRREISLNQIQSLKPNNLVKGRKNPTVEEYRRALEDKVRRRDPKVMRDLLRLKGHTSVANVGDATQPFIAALRDVLREGDTMAAVRHWAELQAKEDHARDPGKYKVFFGRRAGTKLEDLPLTYVDWLQRVIPEFQDFLARYRQAVKAHGPVEGWHSRRGSLSGQPGDAPDVPLLIPDFRNPHVPDYASRAEPKTYLDPVDLVRRYAGSGKEVGNLRFEDAAGRRLADVPPGLRRAVMRFAERVASRNFAEKFSEFVSRPEMAQRLREFADEVAERQEDQLSRKQDREARLRARGVRNLHEEGKGRGHLREPTTSESVEARTRGREPRARSRSELLEDAERRKTLESYKRQAPLAVQGHIVSQGGKILGGRFPGAAEDIAEGENRGQGFESVVTWDAILRAAEAVEDAASRHSARDAEEQIRLALDSLGGADELGRSHHPYAKEILDLARRVRNEVRARTRAGYHRGSGRV